MVTEPWFFETAVEYHVASASLHPPSSPINSTKKRVLPADECTRDGRPCSIHVGPPRVLMGTNSQGYPDDDRPPWSASTSALPGTSRATGRDGAISRATHVSTGSLGDHTPRRTASSYSPLTPPGSRPSGAKPVPSRQHAAVSGPERGLHNRWADGTLSMSLYGEGGRAGGELRVVNTVTGLLVFTARLPSIDEEGSWDIPDVQHLHPSVTERRHAMSLRLRGNSVADERTTSVCMPNGLAGHFQDGSLPIVKSFLAGPGFLSRQPTTSKDADGRFLGGILPRLSRRSRSRTFRKHDGNLSSAVNGSDASRQATPERPEMFQVAAAGDHELFLYMGFGTAQARDDWYGLLRSMARVPIENGRHARRHRRLRVSILDVHERAAIPPPDAKTQASDAAEPKSDTKSARPRRPKSSTMSDPPHGWASREPLRIEMLLDNRLVARTSWTSADAPTPPQWGQVWNFNELPPFSTCTMLFLRPCPKKEKVAIVFGKVEVPLVSTFLGVEDARYPIHSTTGAVIGDIRLNVSYQELDIVPLAEYEAFRSPLTAKFLYVMSGKGVMDGTSEFLCRVGLCEGVLMARVRDTVSFEAKSSGTTLFRSTTPLSKTLESLMRMMCTQYLEASLGRTVRRVISERIQLRAPVGDAESVDRPVVKEVIEGCWADLYVNRHIFPNFIRHVFEHLFHEVKEFHGGGVGKDPLHYKAVSSFVFLRLVGPALMSPHLFGLAESLVPQPQQRTLTLIAKVLHTLAFFSEKDLFRHSDVSMFKDVIEDNGAAMVDYLVFLASPSNKHTELKCVSPTVNKLLLERRRLLPSFVAESLPYLTEAGPIDLSVDWAMCCEIWYEKRRQPGVALVVNATLSSAVAPEISAMMAKYDQFINRVHGLAFPVCATPTTERAPDRSPTADRKGLHRKATIDNKASAGINLPAEYRHHPASPVSPASRASHASPTSPARPKSMPASRSPWKPSTPPPITPDVVVVPHHSPPMAEMVVVEIGAADPSEVVVPRRYITAGEYGSGEGDGAGEERGGSPTSEGRRGVPASSTAQAAPAPTMQPLQPARPPRSFSPPPPKPPLSIDTRAAQLMYRSPSRSTPTPGTGTATAGHRPRTSITADAGRQGPAAHTATSPTSPFARIHTQTSPPPAFTPRTAPPHVAPSRAASVLPDSAPLARRTSIGTEPRSPERKRRPTMPNFPLRLLSHGPRVAEQPQPLPQQQPQS